MGKVATYNPKQVTCAAGSHIVTGFADDSMISIEPGGDGTSYVIGADGETVRSIDPNAVYTIKISLLQTSASNTRFKDLVAADRANGSGIFPLTIKDILGGDVFTASNAWVSKEATWGRGKQQTNREWEIVAIDGQFK